MHASTGVQSSRRRDEKLKESATRSKSTEGVFSGKEIKLNYEVLHPCTTSNNLCTNVVDEQN